MPSAKRKLEQNQRELSKIAKTNRSISSFFGGESKQSEKTNEEVNTETPSSSTPSTPSTRHIAKAKHKYGFNKEWTTTRPWLFNAQEMLDEDMTEVMYCRLCINHKSLGLNGSVTWVHKGCRTLRLDKVTAHENSEQHQAAVKLETEVQMGIEKALSDRKPLNEKEFNALVCASKLLHFLIKHNIPHTTVYEDLIDFAVDDLQSPVLKHLRKGKNATYKSQTTADELLAAMSDEIEATVLERARSSPAYSVMTDEATDIANRKHLAFCIKYVDQETGDVHTDFVKDVQIDDGRAETIFKETKVVVEEDIKLDTFSAFGSDGCNAMVGKKTGVSTRLKEIKPELITVHCHNHRLALAAKNSFESIQQFRDTDEVLTSIYHYYKSSGNRTTSLAKLQAILEDTKSRKIKQAAHTRWLSHLDAVTSLRETYSAVIMDLENSVESGKDKVRIGSGPSASGLAKKLKCFQTVHIIHFLCDALRPLTQLALVFEKNEVDLSIIKPRMEATIYALEKLQKTPGINMKKADKILEEFSITASDKVRASVEEAEGQFIRNLVDNVTKRLDNHDVIDSFSIFNMTSTGPMAGGEELETLAEHFNLDYDKCLTEWDQLKQATKDTPIEQLQGPRALLKVIKQVKPSVGDLFPSIEKLCAVAAVIPVSTAEVERIFSDVNRTVTELRNRLKVETTNKLLMIHQNDRYLDFDSAVKRWYAQRPRRIKF